MSNKIQAVRGMNDVLPGHTSIWQRVESVIRSVTAAYGYNEIRTPIVEHTELFKRGIGEATDIVEKEMYTFVDINNESLTLRPEATASCVRSGIEHGLLHNRQQRWWYMGPMFRRERPQKGRYRQFHQFGIEAMGWTGPDVDAEVMLVGRRLWQELDIEHISLQINTLGSLDSRARFRSDLVAYLEKNKTALDADSQRRLQTNPLRVLDSKVEKTKEIIAEAPVLLNYLDDAARAHFDGLQHHLSAAGVAYEINPLLVRGLDYYTSTVFEWVTDKLGAQNAVCAGGRYDGLVEQLGGKSVPAIGFALGLERMIELASLSKNITDDTTPDVFLVLLGETAEKRGVALAEALRDGGLSVLVNCGSGNVKRQMKRADDSGARLAVIAGDDELEKDLLSIKFLREDKPQIQVPLNEACANLNTMLS